MKTDEEEPAEGELRKTSLSLPANGTVNLDGNFRWIRQRAVTKRIFSPKWPIFLYACATIFSELPSKFHDPS